MHDLSMLIDNDHDSVNNHTEMHRDHSDKSWGCEYEDET